MGVLKYQHLGDGIHGISMEHIYGTYLWNISITYLWKISGISMEYQWQMLCLEDGDGLLLSYLNGIISMDINGMSVLE